MLVIFRSVRASPAAHSRLAASALASAVRPRDWRAVAGACAMPVVVQPGLSVPRATGARHSQGNAATITAMPYPAACNAVMGCTRAFNPECDSTRQPDRPWLPEPLWCRLRWRSEEHTSELQSLMRISYAVFCLKKKKQKYIHYISTEINE